MLFKHSNDCKVAILIVYVDDIIIIGDYEDEIVSLKGNLTSECELKDFRQMQSFLGVEVARLREEILVSQRKFLIDLLAEIGMS